MVWTRSAFRRQRKYPSCKNGVVTTYEITPEELGLPVIRCPSVIGGDAEDECGDYSFDLSAGGAGAYRDIVLANAGACIYVGGRGRLLA